MACLKVSCILITFAAWTSFALAQTPQCPPPISLPITNVTSKDGSVRRGIESSVGTPPQKLIFLAKDLDNMTYLQDTLTICESNYTDSASCEAINGGFFDVSKSSTWRVDNDNATGRPAYDVGGTPNGQYALDTFRLGNRTFEKFYLGLTSNDWPNIAASTFGLSKNSSILFDLQQKALLPSQSWSYFFGLDGDKQADGSLTLGGYDSAIVAPGPNLTLPFIENPDCPTKHQAIVSDMALKWKNGTTTSLLEGTAYKRGLSVCITTTYEYLAELPGELVDSFISKSNSRRGYTSHGALSWNEVIVDADTAYDGDLSITLNNGDLNVTIPNDEFITPEYGISDQGPRHDLNDSNRLVRFSGQDSFQPSTKASMARLGARFFAAAYMITDNERRTFTLTNARPAKEKKLIAIQSDDPKCGGAASASSPDEATSSQPTASSPSGTSAPSRTLAKGAIAGLTVGVICGVAIIALVATLLLRRRRQRNRASTISISSPMASTTVDGSPTEIGSSTRGEKEYRKAELPYDHEYYPPQEMPSAKDNMGVSWRHEMDNGARDQREVLRAIGVQEAPTSPMMNGHTNEIARQSC